MHNEIESADLQFRKRHNFIWGWGKISNSYVRKKEEKFFVCSFWMSCEWIDRNSLSFSAQKTHPVLCVLVAVPSFYFGGMKIFLVRTQSHSHSCAPDDFPPCKSRKVDGGVIQVPRHVASSSIALTFLVIYVNILKNIFRSLFVQHR